MPLLQLEPKRILKYKRISQISTGDDGNVQNLIYNLSEKLHVTPPIICRYLVRSKWMFTHKFSTTDKRLNTLLKYIDAEFILRDLSVFRSSTESIVERMELVKAAGIISPRPWMIKCTREALDRSIKFRTDERMAKGDHQSIVDFLAVKLNMKTKDVNMMLERCPQLINCRFSPVSY